MFFWEPQIYSPLCVEVPHPFSIVAITSDCYLNKVTHTYLFPCSKMPFSWHMLSLESAGCVQVFSTGSSSPSFTCPLRYFWYNTTLFVYQPGGLFDGPLPRIGLTGGVFKICTAAPSEPSTWSQALHLEWFKCIYEETRGVNTIWLLLLVKSDSFFGHRFSIIMGLCIVLPWVTH